MHQIENLEAHRQRMAVQYGIPLLELNRAQRPATPPAPRRAAPVVDPLATLYWWRA